LHSETLPQKIKNKKGRKEEGRPKTKNWKTIKWEPGSCDPSAKAFYPQSRGRH
jgi:hypothetical protein